MTETDSFLMVGENEYGNISHFEKFDQKNKEIHFMARIV